MLSMARIVGPIEESLVPSATKPRQTAPFSNRRKAHLRLGRRGEKLAARLLRELRYDILACNFRSEAGEIDIVARDGETLCFVEVKTRRRIGRARPAAAVGQAKQKHIIRVAHRYLREIGYPHIRYRFDIVEIVLEGSRVRDARMWPAAFTEEPHSDARLFPDVFPEQE